MSTPARRRIGWVGLVALLAAAFALSSPPATAEGKSTDSGLRYSHAQHQKLGVSQKNCRTCHELDSDYNVEPPTKGRNHQPCNDSDCHAKEYFSRDPKICVVCHSDARPWIKQKAELKKRPDSEFGGDLSHKSHATARVGGRGANGACKKCHGNPYRNDAPEHGGHADCAPCHGHSAQPSMGECGDCHHRGARKARIASRSTKWSVAALFAHDTHGRDPRKPQTETECTTCHTNVTKATKLAEVENPTMRSCGACHDGKSAFKATGFQCYRCHSEPKSGGK